MSNDLVYFYVLNKYYILLFSCYFSSLSRGCNWKQNWEYYITIFSICLVLVEFLHSDPFYNEHFYRNWLILINLTRKSDISYIYTYKRYVNNVLKELGFSISFFPNFNCPLLMFGSYHAFNVIHVHVYANAIGYILSIKVEFVMRNMMSICLCCCIWKGV